MWRFALATTVAIGLCLGAGCSKKDEGGGEPTGKKTGGETAETNGKKGTDEGGLGGLIDTKAAVPFGVLAKIQLGMTRAEVMKVDPKLFDRISDGRVSYSVEAGPMMGERKDTDKVHRFRVEFSAGLERMPWDQVAAALEAAWGKPTVAPDFKEETQNAHYWFNPEAGIRAILEPEPPKDTIMAPRLYFSQYTPLAQWLGEPGKPFPFLKDGASLVGMSPADMKAIYDYELEEGGASALDVRATEWDQTKPFVGAWVGEDGNVGYYEIRFEYEHNPEGAAPVLAAIEAKYPGKAIEADTWSQVADDVWVRHDAGNKEVQLHVGTAP